VIEAGLSDHDGTAELLVPTDAFGSAVSGLAWIGGPEPDDRAPRAPIQVRRLDGLIDAGTIAVPRPIFLKMDVEGSEGRVLRGARDLLHRQRPIVYFECQRSSLTRIGETEDDVLSVLAEAGYTIHVIGSGGLARVDTISTEVVNYLALPDVASPRDETMDRPALDRFIERWVAWEPEG
jgi:hypothetical protein